MFWSVGWIGKDEGSFEVVQSLEKVTCKHGCGDTISARQNKPQMVSYNHKEISSWPNLDYPMLSNMEIFATM